MRPGHSTGKLLVADPFANLLDVSDAVAVGDANAFADSRDAIKDILMVNDSGWFRDKRRCP